jgi:hypothetical protein
VLIELPKSKIRFFSEEEIEARDKAERERFEAEMRAHDERRLAEGAGAEIEELEEDEDDIIAPGGAAMFQAEEEEEEGYGLIPEELNSELERKARRTDREAAGESEETMKMMEETELMDEMLDHGKETPLKAFLADLHLPSPAAVLTDEEAERVLKPALMKLALGGVAFHICEHCSLREAYRIFMEEICEKSGVFQPLFGTGWVQNVCTSDYCKECRGE